MVRLLFHGDRIHVSGGLHQFGIVKTLTLDVSSRILHSTLHEALRLLTLPLIVPSPTSGFHSSYYLGLGWGVAEVTWGIVQGWEQLALYQEVMPGPDRIYLPDEEDHDDDEDGQERAKREGMLSAVEERDEEESDREIEEEEDEEEDVLDDSELEKKVEILERMRARRGNCF